MDKRLQLRLNNYAQIPRSLADLSNAAVPTSDVSVDLAKLYHHLYLDSYGASPPNPDPAYFEHARFMTSDYDFRLLGNGIGASTSARRSKSSELGQAFCRWFLHDHLGITYFAHISELLDRQGVRGINGCSIKRIAAGDAPDYLCADDASGVYLAEAKGRYKSISFGSKAFSRWRDQFSRVLVLDAKGLPKSVKGHIVATRFATESDSARIKSTVYAEDPQSPGEGQLEGDAAGNLAAVVTGLHYGRIAAKLNQPILATALRYGMGLPREVRVPVVLWKLGLDTRSDRLFVGGYYPGPSGESAFEFHGDEIRSRIGDPLRLDAPKGTFVGVEAEVFRSVVASCRFGETVTLRIPQSEDVGRLYSAISMLRDGSVVGPVEFFTPVRSEVL